MDKPRVTTTVTKETREGAPFIMPITTYKPAPEAIAKRAYELYEKSGRPDGRDVEFWLEAERELSER
jgi:DUF2934 family protein